MEEALSSHLKLAEELRTQLLTLQQALDSRGGVGKAGHPPDEGTPPGEAGDRERLMALARNLSDTEHLQQLCELAEQLQAKEKAGGGGGAMPMPPEAAVPIPGGNKAELHAVGAVSVEFGAQAGKLGISFEAPSESDAPRIKAITPDGAAAAFPELKVGLELASIQGRSVAGMKMKDCMAAIRNSGRPIKLGFNHSAQTLFTGRSANRDGDYDSDDSGDMPALAGTVAPGLATPTRVAVEFSEAGRLGMSFGSDTDDGAPPVKVTRVTSGGLAAADGNIRTGMTIVRIGDSDCSSWPLKQVVSAIKAAPRPLTLEFLPEDDLPSLALPDDVEASTRKELLKSAAKDDDMYSPSGGTRGGGVKVLAKAGGEAPPLGEYKLLANCKCYKGKELDAAPCDFSLDKDEIFHVQEVALVEDGVIRLRSADG